MKIKNGIFEKKIQEVPNIDYLKKLQKEILKQEEKIKGIKFDLKNVIEFNTPLLQFLVSLKKYTAVKGKSFELLKIPYSGEDLVKLYKIDV